MNSPKLPSLYQIEIYAFLARTRPPPHGHTVYYYKERKATCEPYTSYLYRIYFYFTREFPRVSDWSELQCTLNNRKQPSKVAADNSSLSVSTAVSGVRPSEFLCSYETHCFALCMCCDFFACDCRMKCSDGCHCFHDQVITYVHSVRKFPKVVSF